MGERARQPDTVARLPINAITRTHPDLVSLLEELDLPPSPMPASSPLSQSAVMDVLELLPPQARASRDQTEYVCIGGLRSLELARNLLEPDTRIPVRLLAGRLDKTAMRRRTAIELLLLPLLLGAGESETQAIKSLRRRASHLPEALQDELPLTDIGAIASMLGVDTKTVRRYEND